MVILTSDKADFKLKTVITEKEGHYISIKSEVKVKVIQSFRRGVRASGSYQEGTGKSGSYGMWNPPRGHVWNVFVRPASS